MKRNWILIGIIFLIFMGCYHSNPKRISNEEISVKILDISVNHEVDSDSTLPPEIYYKIELSNNSSSYIYIENITKSLALIEEKANFQIELGCNDTIVSFNLYSVTSPLKYIKTNSVDIINLKVYFKEILSKQNECGYDKISGFVHSIMKKGKVIYVNKSNQKINDKQGVSYSSTKSFSVSSSKDTGIEIIL